MKIIEKLLSKRNKPICIHESFIYNMAETKNTVVRWRCKLRTCGGALYVDAQEDIVNFISHNHVASEVECEKLRCLQKINSRIKSSNESTFDIISREISGLSDGTIIIMPKLENVRDRITRERNRNLGFGGTDYEDIPDFLKKTLRGECFLQFDSGYFDSERILIFYSEENFNWLKKAETILIDGTFRTCPSEYYQLYTIHGVLFGRTQPLIYLLMKSKSKMAYERAFKVLNKELNLFPKYILSDFELAAIIAAKEVFVESILNGCIFHFGQSIWRKVQELGLSKIYLQGGRLSEFVRMCLSLSFIPTCEVNGEYLNILKRFEDINNSSELIRFKEYFSRMYVGYFGKDGKIIKEPVFPVEFWSVNQRIRKNIPRTTNSIESWHRSLNARHSIAHPNIGKFISSIQKEEELVRYNIVRAKNGLLECSRKDFEKEERLRLIVENYYKFEGSGFFVALNDLFKWEFKE